MLTLPGRLTVREKKVVQAVADGAGPSAMAMRANVRQQSGEALLRSLREKFQVGSDVELVEAAYVAGAIDVPEVVAGEGAVHLLDEQRALIPLIARGMNAEEIAVELGRPASGVRADGRALLQAMGALTLAHLLTRAREYGLHPPKAESSTRC